MGFGDFAGSLVGAVSNYIGGKQAENTAKDVNRENAALQREFAQSGIQWRVADAKAAGIHPVYALGAQTTPASPSYVGSNASEHFSQMGQNLGRAAAAAMNSGQRKLEQISIQSAEADLQGKEIDNQIKARQLSQMSGAGIGPAMPTVDGMSAELLGQGDVNGLLPPPVQLNSNSVVRADPDNPSKEGGAITDYGLARTATGSMALVPSKDVKERIEDTFFPDMSWSLRNIYVTDSPPKPDPSLYPLPRGASQWKWNPLRQEFQPYYPNKKYGRFHYFRYAK